MTANGDPVGGTLGHPRLAVLALVALSCGKAQPSTVPTPAPARVRIPAEVRGYLLSASEPVQGAPAESLYRFTPPGGVRTTVTVFVYDIPADVRGTDTRQDWVDREGRKFGAVMDLLRSRGRYDAVQMGVVRPDPIDRGGRTIPGFVSVAVTRSQGRVVVEMEHIYLVGDQLVKIRASVPQAEFQASDVRPFGHDLVARIVGRPPGPGGGGRCAPAD